MVIFIQFSPTRAAPVVSGHRTKNIYQSDETQRFQFFIRSLLENLSLRIGRKLSENYQRVVNKALHG